MKERKISNVSMQKVTFLTSSFYSLHLTPTYHILYLHLSLSVFQ